MSKRIEKSEQAWRAQLGDEAYRITRLKGTEPAFTGAYWDHKEPGRYLCVGCGQALFDAASKYDSGSGWPSYWQAIDAGAVQTDVDRSHGMTRTEVRCSRCDAHLGHRFEDGPAPSGQRYCINSAALNFTPAEPEVQGS